MRRTSAETLRSFRLPAIGRGHFFSSKKRIRPACPQVQIHGERLLNCAEKQERNCAYVGELNPVSGKRVPHHSACYLCEGEQQAQTLGHEWPKEVDRTGESLEYRSLRESDPAQQRAGCNTLAIGVLVCLKSRQ